MPTARSLAGRIQDELGVEADLVAGGGGIFDVHQGDELVYSKFKSGRFPDETELVASLKRA